jgi:hypothetical protein
VPLSPSIAVVDRLARGFDARITGHFERACEIYRDTLELIESTNGGGLDPTFVESMRAALPSIIGMIEAGLGLESAERHADEVAEFPLYQGSALTIRMVQRLWLGDIASATALARQSELARLEQARAQTGDVLATLWVLQAHAASDDLTHTRQYLEAAERLARKMRTWAPVASWARAEYERIRGDFAAALAAVDAALAELPEAEHQIWPFAASARVRILCEQGRFEEAREAGERYLAAAEARGLGYVVSYIRMPLAVAAAKLGDGARALRLVEDTIAQLDGLGARGINMGLAYETGARVAALLGDQAEAERYAGLCKECYLAFPNPALAAKYQRLSRATRVRRAHVEGEDAASAEAVSATAYSHMESLLQTCSTSEERLLCALQWMVSNAGAEGGALYGFADGTITLRAQSDPRGLPPEVEAETMRYVQTQLGVDGDETASATGGDSGDDPSEGWTSAQGRFYRPLLLNHASKDGFVASGVVVLAFESASQMRVAGEALSFLSRTMVQAGDLSPVLIAS